jgi:hypothetical protein
LQYEVSLTVEGHTKDVTIAPGGTINEIEEEVFPDKLPSVREELQKTQATTGGKKSEIQVGPDGGNLAHPEIAALVGAEEQLIPGTGIFVAYTVQ